MDLDGRRSQFFVQILAQQDYDPNFPLGEDSKTLFDIYVDRQPA